MKKNWYKGITATAITLAMAGAALTVPAMAIDYDLNYGDVYVGEDETGVWSGQTNNPDEGYFYYVKSEDSYYYVEGKYYHKDGGDNTVNISQGTINTEDFAEEADIPQTGVGSNQVNISGDLSESDIEINIASGESQPSDESQTSAEGENTVNVTLTGVVTNDTGNGISVSGDVDIHVVGNNQLNAGDGGAGLDIAAGSDVTITGFEQVVTTEDENTTTEAGTIQSNQNAIQIDSSASENTTSVDIKDLTVDADKNAVIVDEQPVMSANSANEQTNSGSAVDLALENSSLYGDNYGLYIDNSNVSLDYDGMNTISGNIGGVYMGGETELTLTADKTASTEEMKEYESSNNVADLSGDVLLVTSTGSTDKEIGFGITMQGAGDKTLNVQGGTTLVDNNSRININVGNFTGDVTFNIGELDSAYTSSGERVTTEKEGYETNFSASNESTHGGFYIANKGVTTLNVQNAYFRADNNGFDGIYAGSNLSSEFNTGSYINVTDSYFSASGNKDIGISYSYSDTTSATFNIVDSIVHLDRNGYRGTNAGHHTYRNSTITADDNNGTSNADNAGVGIMAFTIDSINSAVSANNNREYGIWLMGDGGEAGDPIIHSGFTNSTVTTNENGDRGFIFSSAWKSSQNMGELYFDNSTIVANGNSAGGFDTLYNVLFRNDSLLATVGQGDYGVYACGDLIFENSQLYSLGNKNCNLYLGYKKGNDVADESYGKYIQLDGTFSVLDNHAVEAGVINAQIWDEYIKPYWSDKNTRFDIFQAWENSRVIITGGSLYLSLDKCSSYVVPRNGEDGEALSLIILDQNGMHRDFDVVSENVYGVNSNGTYGAYDTLYDYISRQYDNEDQKIYAWVPTATVTYWTDLDGDGVYTDSEIQTTPIIRGGSPALMIGSYSGTITQYEAINPYIPADSQFGEIPEDYFLTWYDAEQGGNVYGLAGQAPSYTVYGDMNVYAQLTQTPEPPVDPPYIPDYPELPDYDPPEVDIDDPDVPLVEEPEEPEEPEQPTEEIDDEETPLTPSIPDEVVDEIIAEIEDEVTPLTSVPKTGAEMPAATAALPAGVLALAVAALVRRTKRKN